MVCKLYRIGAAADLLGFNNGLTMLGCLRYHLQVVAVKRISPDGCTRASGVLEDP